ncbi:MAG: RHS repeat-associated core domain-containing protein [Fimbriimonadaceae bacterium]|nr:RHS repeat-associated core domain-containing protein [Fimbriimonadaceae bacterium]
MSGTDTVDVARYGLGPRGIESHRVYSGSVSGALAQTALGFPVYDTHGNNVAMLALDGSVAHERTYSPWGEVVSTSGSPPQQGYCANLGHRQDGESSLIYMRARYYEPTTGRFITEDPAKDGANWYAYCASDPLNKIDSAGTQARWSRLLGAGLSLVGLQFLGMALALSQLPPHLTYLAAQTQFAMLAVTFISIGLAFTGGLDDWNSGLLAIGGAIVSSVLSSVANQFMTEIALMGTNAATGNQTLARNAVTVAYAYSLILIGYIVAINLQDPWLQ